MTINKLLIIFLSLTLAISCSNDATNPIDQQQTENAGGGGGHLNNFGNGDLIEDGSSDANVIASFINKYAGVYYESGKVTYKLYEGKIYENPNWQFEEITADKIIVQPNGNKMQISNRGGLGTIEVLNFADNGFSSFSSYILVKDASVDTSMTKVGQEEALKGFSGTYTFSDTKGSEKFLSIDADGNIYFKQAAVNGGVYMDNGDLVIVDNSNNKNVIKFKEGNFVYRKYTRSGYTDTTVYSCSVTKDFIESLGEAEYAGDNKTIEFNKFNAVVPAGVKAYAGGVKISYDNTGLYSKVTKTSILKGKTLTVYGSGSGLNVKVDWTLTFNDDNSEATFVQNGQNITVKKVN